jgi:two-component system chemotaxis response regulator CheY
MRIYTDDSAHYIHSLADSISKDPVSLEAWHCLHVTLPAEYTETITSVSRDNAIRNLKDIYKNIDCDIIFCPDHDLLFISTEESRETLRAMATYLMHSMMHGDIVIGMQDYQLLAEWREVRNILLAKSDPLNREMDHFIQENNTPPDEESFREIFEFAKEIRKSRDHLHILLVEDDLFTRQLVAHAFKNNYALITAGNAQKALENYLIYAPDIVFLDINLPDENGFHVLRQIISCDPLAYVIMFSGNSYLDNVTNALTHGASGFIAKPFNKERLQYYIYECQAARG